MDSRKSLETVCGTGEGAVMVYGGLAPAEGDEKVEGPIVEFIPEEREPSEDANDNSSGEKSWPDPATEEVEEEEDVELPLPTMRVPPLEENKVVVMAGTPLLYDQDSHRSEAIWHGETLRYWLVDERMLSYIEAAGFSALYRVQWLRLDKPLITALVERWRSETNIFHLANVVAMGTSTYWTFDTPRGTGAAGWPFRFQVKWQPYLDFMQHLPAICVEGRRIWLSRTPLIWFEIIKLHIPDRVMLQFGLEQVTPPEDVEHVTRISRKGRAGEDWALYHRDYIARWEAQPESVVMGSRAHTPRHAPSDYMRWYLGATRRFISPPPIEPAMVYHPRGYTEEALALDPSSADPYLMEIGHYCQSVLHGLPLLEGVIVGGDVSHAVM
ncbi:hypothetical protein H6P81_003326 [Aristolochia fimbriata]|uniref:Aminotransferase-like plant mobile domain-containing protein n=1 Tax=Aristolochia fimbriata TaxID=158543 RepID=A0AAV7FD09_ARIFI|nr:hypothetical protein H6P81_003326 [Aristolochia fimbriata]